CRGRADGGVDPYVRRPRPGLRPPGAPAARSPCRADPRAGGRTRGERAARRARALFPRGGGSRLGPAADDECLHAHSRRDARPRVRLVDGQGDPAAGAHGRFARPPGRGARAARRLPDGRKGRGGDPLPATGGGRAMTAPTCAETRPWSEQRRVDEPAYRRQVAYLLERSAFYRDKLSAAGITSAGAAGGLAEIGGLPLTGKDEIRATCTPDRPIGAHVCVDP